MSFNEICSPLKTFHSSRELVVSVRDAMEGEQFIIIYFFENNILTVSPEKKPMIEHILMPIFYTATSILQISLQVQQEGAS